MGSGCPKIVWTVTSLPGGPSQLHLAGNFWVLGDQPRNLPSPEFIMFIPTSSFLDRGLKRAGSAFGSLWYPNAQQHNQGSVPLYGMSKCPPRLPTTSLPGDRPSFATQLKRPVLSDASQPPQLGALSLLIMTHTSCWVHNIIAPSASNTIPDT